MFWKKKEPVKKEIKKKEKEEEKTIIFDVKDDCFTRAEKLASICGIVNWRGLENNIARGVKVYMDLDKKLEETQRTKPRKKKTKEDN